MTQLIPTGDGQKAEDVNAEGTGFAFLTGYLGRTRGEMFAYASGVYAFLKYENHEVYSQNHIPKVILQCEPQRMKLGSLLPEEGGRNGWRGFFGDDPTRVPEAIRKLNTP